MKRQKVVQALLLAALLVFQAVPFPATSYGTTQITAEAATKKAEITNVETETLTIEKGEAFQLKANRSDVVWKSSNKKIVSVNKAGKLKGMKNGMEIVNGVFQNGDMTITENIADMGAMACALEIAGDDKEAQRKVFGSNAAIWASNQTDQYRDYLLMVDVHSLNKVRVNAILPLFDQFYDVFEVTKNDVMYVAKEDRVQIW